MVHIQQVDYFSTNRPPMSHHLTQRQHLMQILFNKQATRLHQIPIFVPSTCYCSNTPVHMMGAQLTVSVTYLPNMNYCATPDLRTCTPIYMMKSVVSPKCNSLCTHTTQMSVCDARTEEGSTCSHTQVCQLVFRQSSHKICENQMQTKMAIYIFYRCFNIKCHD